MPPGKPISKNPTDQALRNGTFPMGCAKRFRTKRTRDGHFMRKIQFLDPQSPSQKNQMTTVAGTRQALVKKVQRYSNNAKPGLKTQKTGKNSDSMNLLLKLQKKTH
jgi:hypothetical protein